MDLRKLKALVDLVSESGVSELEITEGEDRVRIVNSRPGMPVNVSPMTVAPTTIEVANPLPVTPAVETPQIEEKKSEGTPLTGPMVGTFYRAPSPGADPFVQVGDKVKKGQVVCIIEAMKLLNEVEAEQEGTIREICVDNGQPVEFGQPLFILE